MILEKIIEERLRKSYSLERGLAAAAARDIAEDIQGEFRLELLPYLDGPFGPSLASLGDRLLDMAKRDIFLKRTV